MLKYKYFYYFILRNNFLTKIGYNYKNININNISLNININNVSDNLNILILKIIYIYKFFSLNQKYPFINKIYLDSSLLDTKISLYFKLEIKKKFIFIFINLFFRIYKIFKLVKIKYFIFTNLNQIIWKIFNYNDIYILKEKLLNWNIPIYLYFYFNGKELLNNKLYFNSIFFMKRINFILKDKIFRYNFKLLEIEFIRLKFMYMFFSKINILFSFFFKKKLTKILIKYKKIKIKNRCIKSGIATYINRKYKLGRMVIKKYMSLKKINGLKKASW